MWVGAYPFCILPLDSKIQRIPCTPSRSNKVFQIKLPHSFRPRSWAPLDNKMKEMQRQKDPGESGFAREQIMVRNFKTKYIALWQDAYLRQKRIAIKERENFAKRKQRESQLQGGLGECIGFSRIWNKQWQNCKALFYFGLRELELKHSLEHFENINVTEKVWSWI